MWKPVFLDGAPDRRRYRGVLDVGEVDCRHGFYIHEGLISPAVKRIGALI
jgi:hypothetical protein